jgi:hypothetical protein
MNKSALHNKKVLFNAKFALNPAMNKRLAAAFDAVLKISPPVTVGFLWKNNHG